MNGSLSGMIENLEQSLKIIDKETIVIPGHGEVTDYKTVKKYLEALIMTKEKLLENGDRWESILAANIKADNPYR